MLDTDPTDFDSSSSGDDGSSGPADTAAAAPRKRAPRKAVKKAGPPAAAPPADAPSADTPPADALPEAAAPAADASSAADDAPAPRKRTPRKAAAKKVSAPSSEDAADAAGAAELTPSPDASSEPVATRSAPAKRTARKRTAKAPADELPLEVTATTTNTDAAAAADTAADTDAAPPAKRTARKRTAKKAAVEPAAENATDATPALETGGSAGPQPAAMSTPGVLFMAPTATDAGPATAGTTGASTADRADDGATGEPPTRRRRAAKKTAPATDATPTDAVTGGVADLAAADPTAVAEPDEDADEADPDDVREAAIEQANGARRRRRRGRRGRGGGAKSDDSGDDSADESDDPTAGTADATDDDTATSGDDADDSETEGSGEGSSSRRRRRRRRSSGGGGGDDTSETEEDPPNTVTHVREKKASGKSSSSGSGKGGGSSSTSGDDDGVRGIKGSTRLEAKRQRRRDGRETTRRRAPILTEAEFLARREAVDRVMAVRQRGDRTQIAVLEDDILVEHYVTRASATSYVGNVYLGKVQNVLPSMEAAFIDIGKGRNGVLYAGEVNWDAAGLDGKSRTIEHAMKSGDSVLVQVTKDPIGHKGARLTSQVSLPGRFLVYVPGGGMTGISRRLPDTERHRLKAILKKIVPDEAGVIVRTAAEGASDEDLTHDVERLQAQWDAIQETSRTAKSAPVLLHGEPDLAIRVVRDVFNEDFSRLVVDGEDAWTTVSDYVANVAPDLGERVSRHTGDNDVFHDLRVDEQLMKALDRKVWLPSGGSLVIDRTEAMTVVDVNTGRFVGSGGNLEQTVTRNNLEAAEEIVRQLRLRDVGGIVVIDFIDMVLESNRDLVLRRLTECLGRDRTKHQVAEVTSLGLVQMTRKRVGEGLLEAFSEPCEHCHGRGVLVHGEPVDSHGGADDEDRSSSNGRKRGRRGERPSEPVEAEPPATDEQRQAAAAAIAAIHRATAAEAAEASGEGGDGSALATLATDLVNAANAARDAGKNGSTPHPVEAQPEVQTPDRTSEPTGPEPEASETVSSPSEAISSPSEAVSSPSGAVSSPSETDPPVRRRRRAASRPAGPPVQA